MIDLLAEARKLIAWASDDDGEGVTNQAAALFYAAATAYATLAIAEDLTNQRPAGACPSFLLVGSPIFEAPDDEHVYCQHPDGHTGLHSNNPDHNPTQFESRWTDWAEGARRLDQETQ